MRALAGFAAAAVLAAAGHAAAQPATPAGAQQWVRSVYAAYTDGPDANGPGLYDNVFSARLNRLIRQYGPAGDPGNRGVDADPICNCQDWENVRVLSTAARMRGRDRADVDVRFSNMGEESRHTLRLVRERGSWRVDDIVGPDGHRFASEFHANAEWLR